MMIRRYIRMCEEAEEIQEYWRKRGCQPDDEVLIYSNGKKVWLPTQEQLQRMVKPFFGDIKSLFRNFALWLLGRYSTVLPEEYIELFDTGNEVTLAFVMWEMYQKVWDDKDEKWVKGGE